MNQYWKCFFVTCFSGILLSAQTVVGLVRDQGPALTAPTNSTPPEQRCVIEGRVTNSQTGVPIKRAEVRLVRHERGGPARTSGPQGYTGSSEADGTFKFEGIEPGEYSLSGNHSGFLNTQFGATRVMSPGTILNLQPAQKLSNLNLALIPQSIVSGKVVDDDGEPVQGARVQAMSERWMNGKLQWMPPRWYHYERYGRVSTGESLSRQVLHLLPTHAPNHDQRCSGFTR